MVINNVRINNADDLYKLATSLGLKDSDNGCRKMTNGEMTVNVVKWGQTKNFDEWYVTDTKKGGKTLVIIDKAYKSIPTYKYMQQSDIRLFSVPSAPPQNGGWKWL